MSAQERSKPICPNIEGVICKFAFLCASAVAATLNAASPAELIVCGLEEVFIIDTSAPQDRFPEKVWSWKAESSRELPPHMQSKFRTTDECKAVDSGSRILITASSDGVALVERSSGKVEVYGSAANAHSAELLPGRRIAVAASHRGTDGDRLLIFDISTPEKVVFETPLTWGHGVVWDEKRRVLWALSGDDVRAYSLENWESTTPELRLRGSYPLPSGGGHDLYPVPGTPHLGVTGSKECWLFDRDKRAFAPYPRLANLHNIKSISTNPLTGRTVYVQADPGGWWTDKLRFFNPEGMIRNPGDRFYKARWAVGTR